MAATRLKPIRSFGALPARVEADINALITEVNRNKILNGADITASSSPGGTFLKLRRSLGGGSGAATNPSFYVYKFSATEIKVTAGRLFHPNNEVSVAVAESAALTVANADKVWLERTGNNTWGFNKGAAWPTDKLYFYLFNSVTVTDGVVSLDEAQRVWAGGDIFWPEVMPVTLSSPTGEVGSISADCALTYTVTTLGLIPLFASTTAPVNLRTAKCEYTPATKGVAWFTASGAFEFYAFEKIKGDVIDLAMDLRLDSGNVQIGTRQMTVLEAGTSTTWTTKIESNESDVVPCA